MLIDPVGFAVDHVSRSPTLVIECEVLVSYFPLASSGARVIWRAIIAEG